MALAMFQSRATLRPSVLIKLLEEVRGASRTRALGTARATFRALKANRRIEKLRNAMKDQQASLDTALTHDIR